MLAFISENSATIIGAIIVFAILALIIVRQIRHHKQHKSSCGCNCSGYPNSDSRKCHPK